MLERLERLAQMSAYQWNLTRRVFSPKQAEAEALVRSWMEEAGLAVCHDPAGNLIGRIEGSIPGGPAVMIGGHIDTRADASRYDGTLGVLMGIDADPGSKFTPFDTNRWRGVPSTAFRKRSGSPSVIP